MTRAERVGTLALGGVIIIAWAAWWAPSLALVAARLAAARLRFRAEMATADVLIVLGRDRAARRLLVTVIRRNSRKIRAKQDSMRRRARNPS